MQIIPENALVEEANLQSGENGQEEKKTSAFLEATNVDYGEEEAKEADQQNIVDQVPIE